MGAGLADDPYGLRLACRYWRCGADHLAAVRYFRRRSIFFNAVKRNDRRRYSSFTGRLYQPHGLSKGIDMLDNNPTFEITTGPLPASRKIYVKGKQNGVQVAMREVDLTAGSGEAPVRIYD